MEEWIPQHVISLDKWASIFIQQTSTNKGIYSEYN